MFSIGELFVSDPVTPSSLSWGRDVWSEAGIQEVIQCHFIFWQKEDISAEGRSFIRLYTVTWLPSGSRVTVSLFLSGEHLAPLSLSLCLYHQPNHRIQHDFSPHLGHVR
jgi:hypothetical protein